MTATAAEARESALARLEQRARLTSSYLIRLDPEAVQALEKARLAVDELEEQDEPGDALDEALAVLRERQAALDEATVEMLFEGLPPVVFEELLHSHRPTSEEIADALERDQPRPDYGKEFKPALVAACCTFPGFESADQAQEYLWGGRAGLSSAEADDVFLAALQVCTGRRQVVDWGKDFARTLG
jgi:hypothetical protein